MATVNTPMTEDLDGGGYLIKALGDLKTKGPWADVREYSSFANAISTIGTANKTLLIPNEQAVSTSVTVPSNVTLWFLRDGRLKFDTGGSVTLNGQIVAGLFMIFKQGTAGVSVSGLTQAVYPEWFGATSNGSANESTEVQKAMDSGAPVAVFTNTYKVNNIAVPSSVKEVRGPGKIKQNQGGTGTYNLLTASSRSSNNPLFIHDLFFEGVGDTAFRTDNCGVRGTSSDHITVRDCRFYNLPGHGVYLTDCNDFVIGGNIVWACGGGIRLEACENGTVVENELRDTAEVSQLAVAIGLDAYNGSYSPGYCVNVTVVGNVIRGYSKGSPPKESQAVLVHAGERLAISDNVISDVTTGVYLGPNGANDVIRDVAVIGNSISCLTTTADSAVEGSLGIDVSGKSGSPVNLVKRVTVSGNTIRDANVATSKNDMAGIRVQIAQQVVISGNEISGCVQNGIWVGNSDVSRLTITDNVITDVSALNSMQYGIRLAIAVTYGIISGNVVKSSGTGISIASAGTDLLIDRNQWLADTPFATVAGQAVEGVMPYTAGATTPSMKYARFMRVANSATTTITNFLDAVDGQVITLMFSDGYTTVNRANAYLAGSNDFTSSNHATLVLVKYGAYWQEVSRVTNNG